MTSVVKHAGHVQDYDQRKLYASVHASCLSARTPIGAATLVADRVCQHIAPWLEQKAEVTSADIRRVASHYLHMYNPDAAYIFANARRIMA